MSYLNIIIFNINIEECERNSNITNDITFIRMIADVMYEAMLIERGE